MNAVALFTEASEDEVLVFREASLLRAPMNMAKNKNTKKM